MAETKRGTSIRWTRLWPPGGLLRRCCWPVFTAPGAARSSPSIANMCFSRKAYPRLRFVHRGYRSAGALMDDLLVACVRGQTAGKYPDVPRLPRNRPCAVGRRHIRARGRHMRRRISTGRAATISGWRCHPAIPRPVRCCASATGCVGRGHSIIRARATAPTMPPAGSRTPSKHVSKPAKISGVRGAGVVERRDSAIETSIDRFGGDYRSFALATTDASGEACRKACEGEARCRAWTYARPGYAGRSARCFLKSTVTPPRRRPGLISGVVR